MVRVRWGRETSISGHWLGGGRGERPASVVRGRWGGYSLAGGGSGIGMLRENVSMLQITILIYLDNKLF